MTAAVTQIVIRHLSGSKTNQIEQFNLDGLSEITLGRDPSSRIVYDLQRDDAVSRKHAVIRIKNDKELYFRIADLNSSNGTLLNGERISGEVELLPDDVVELGEMCIRDRCRTTSVRVRRCCTRSIMTSSGPRTSCFRLFRRELIWNLGPCGSTPI